MNKKVANRELITLPNLKNYASRKDWETACWYKILLSRNLLDSLTTFNERHNIVLRAAAIEEIHSGKTYKEISGELFLSPHQIRQGLDTSVINVLFALI